MAMSNKTNMSQTWTVFVVTRTNQNGKMEVKAKKGSSGLWLSPGENIENQDWVESNAEIHCERLHAEFSAMLEMKNCSDFDVEVACLEYNGSVPMFGGFAPFRMMVCFCS